MMDKDLLKAHCIPCEGGVAPLTGAALAQFQAKVDPAWKISDDKTYIRRVFIFKNFAAAMALANKIADIAETEGHHPDLAVSWGKLAVTLSTHAIGGLSENDFILARKIDALTS